MDICKATGTYDYIFLYKEPLPSKISIIIQLNNKV